MPTGGPTRWQTQPGVHSFEDEQGSEGQYVQLAGARFAVEQLEAPAASAKETTSTFHMEYPSLTEAYPHATLGALLSLHISANEFS